MNYAKLNAFVSIIKKMDLKHNYKKEIQCHCIEVTESNMMASDCKNEVHMFDFDIKTDVRFHVNTESFLDAFKLVHKSANVVISKKGIHIQGFESITIPFIIHEGLKDDLYRMKTNVITNIGQLNVPHLTELNLFAISPKDDRRVLEGVYVDVKEKCLVATNGRALGWRSYTNLKDVQADNTIIPSHIIKILPSLKTSYVDFSVCKTVLNETGTTPFDIGIISNMDGLMIKYKMSEEEYPQWKNVLPPDYGTGKHSISLWMWKKGYYLCHDGRIFEESSMFGKPSNYTGTSFRIHSDVLEILLKITSDEGSKIKIQTYGDDPVETGKHPIVCYMDAGLDAGLDTGLSALFMPCIWKHLETTQEEK
jgi:hypothetical protein